MNYSKNFYQIRSNESVFKEIEDEVGSVGYYNLPLQDTSQIKSEAKSIESKYIAIIGIGGSTLGTIAIYNFLKRSNSYDKSLHFFESTDPTDIKSKLSKIELEQTHFIIISKSGKTVETISIFKYLSSLVTIDSSNSTIISERETPLRRFAQKHNIRTFELAENIGGRFSVFSAVGLFPLAVIGVDIDRLLAGAREIRDSFFSQGEHYQPTMEKARFLVENKSRFNINVLFSYSAALEGFNKWYVQLWGESLGKLNINGTRQSHTPIGLIGPVDQHSFLQLIVEGKRNKTVTFIKIDDFKDDTIIPPDTLSGFDELEYLDGLKFSKLIDEQADATIESIQDLKDIPCDVITIDKADEHSIAKLMYNYQLLTSIIGKFVQIDTYNQPGVEEGKAILTKRLEEQSKLL